MRYEEALAWLRGERSTINYRKTIDPESDVRVAQEDAALNRAGVLDCQGAQGGATH